MANLDGRTQQRINKARGGRDQDPSPSRSSAPSTRRRPRRVVLDAVEIGLVRARSLSSSHYPSPPISRAYSDVILRDSSSYATRPPTERDESTSPESSATLCVKTSKYFDRASPLDSTPQNLPVLTLISPIITPIYIESSDFEYSPLDLPFSEAVEHALDKSTGTPTWYNSPGLFDDLMSMLRRLKPILIQGGCFLWK